MNYRDRKNTLLGENSPTASVNYRERRDRVLAEAPNKLVESANGLINDYYKFFYSTGSNDENALKTLRNRTQQLIHQNNNLRNYFSNNQDALSVFNEIEKKLNSIEQQAKSEAENAEIIARIKAGVKTGEKPKYDWSNNQNKDFAPVDFEWSSQDKTDILGVLSGGKIFSGKTDNLTIEEKFNQSIEKSAQKENEGELLEYNKKYRTALNNARAEMGLPSITAEAMEAYNQVMSENAPSANDNEYIQLQKLNNIKALNLSLSAPGQYNFLEVSAKGAETSADSLNFKSLKTPHNIINGKEAARGENWKYTLLTESEKATWNYYIGTNDLEKAKEYIDSIEASLNERLSQTVSKEWDAQGAVGDLKELGASIYGGLEKGTLDIGRSAIGVADAFNQQNMHKGLAGMFAPTYSERLSNYVLADSEGSDGFFFNGLLKALNSSAYQIPSLLLSAAGGGAVGYIMQSVGASTTEAIRNNTNSIDDVIYGVYEGTMEFAVDRLLGGASSQLAGKGASSLTEKLLGTVDKLINNKMVKKLLSKAVIQLGTIGSEGFEEFIQALAEPAARAVIYGEKMDYSIDTLNNALEAAFVGVLAGSIMGLPSIKNTYNQYQAEAFGNNYIASGKVDSLVKFAENFGATDISQYDAVKEAVLNKNTPEAADVAALYANTMKKFQSFNNTDVAKFIKNTAAQDNVQSIADILFNGNTEAAQKFIDRYSGMSVSEIAATAVPTPEAELPSVILGTAQNYDEVEAARKEIADNENKSRTEDIAKIKSAVQSRLVELGEKGNIEALSSAITKVLAGEQLTKSEQRIISESRFGQRVLNEATAENVESGEYSSGWAEKIGTERINSRAYNLGVEGVDSAENNEYNNGVENTSTGGNINGSENAELLARGKVSAVSGGRNSLREQSPNTAIIRGELGALSGNQGADVGILAAGTSGWISGSDRQPATKVGGGLDENFLRGVRGVALKDTDTIGRQLSPELKERLKDTVFRDEEGRILSFFHWTPNSFEAFKYGDGAFHFGTLPTAISIKGQSDAKVQGNFKEVYINSKNPLVVYDNGSFSPSVISQQLVRYGLMSKEDVKTLSEMQGFYSNDINSEACQYMLEYIKELGFDSYFYVNKHENTGSWSVGVFDASQIITVAENGVLKENCGVTEADSSESANFMPENSDLQSTAESLSFDEENTAAPLNKSYEQRVIEESKGIDSSLNAAQRRINKIAEKLGVKLEWDIEGDPSLVGNGCYENGVIHMNKQAKAKATVFAHEYVHYIEQSKLWPAFREFIESTKAYKNWIIAKGNHSDIKQATENYTAQLETAYKKAGKKIADTDIVANFIAECLFGGNYDGSAETKAETLLQKFAENDKWYHNLARFLKGVISRLKGDKVQAELLKMERILQRARKDAQKNPTTDTGGRKYSLNTEFTKADIDTNYKKVISMEAVADLNGDEFAKGSVDLVTQVEEFFNSIGNVTESKYGTVELNRTGIKSSIGHGIGRNKAVAFKAVPSVLQKGEVIDYQENWKNRGYDTAVFAAPIKISNQDYFMAAVVNVEKNKNSYYLHEIVLQKKENDASFKTGTAKNGTPSEASFSIYSLLQKLQNVNDNSSKPYSVTPASEAETIARLVAEGRADEYKTEKNVSNLDARKTAEFLLKDYKSKADKSALTKIIEKMKTFANGSVWDAVLREAETAAGIILENAEIKSSKKDVAMGIFNQLVESRESIRREQLADVQSKNEQYRRQLNDAQKDLIRKIEQLKQSREEIRNEVLKERSDYSNRVKNRERIRKAVNSLDSKLRANSNVKHVPEGMQNAIRDFCRLFFENDKATFSGKDFAALYLAYSRNIGGDDSLDLIGGYTEDVLEMIGTAAEILEGKSLPKLKDSELVLLREIAENLVHIVNNENELFINGKKKNLEEIGSKALEELQDKDSKKSLRLPGGDKVNEAKAEAERFFGTGNLKPIYFFETLGDTFKNLFSDMLEGQYECVRRLETAQTYVQGILTDFNYWQWIDSEPIVIRLEKGGSIKLTKGQAMSLYATWRRESTNELQGAQHLTVGGVVLNDKQVSKKLNKKGKEGLLNYEEWVTKAHKLTENDIKAVMESLTSQQIEFVDEMVSYLSNDMAVIGNEVTMNLYGIKRFKEDYYFPYKTAENFRPNESNGKKKEKKLKNSSFTKQTVEKAKTPVVIEDFLEVWAKHVAEMCQYSTMTLPIENMQRVLGFRMSPDDNLNAQAVRAEVQRVAGKEGVQYVQQLLNDLNGGLVSLPGDSWYHLAVSRFKKNAVFASASVVVQQPSAVCRAFAVISPKYFVKTTLKIAERNYAELKKYCPVAVLKEAGRFDVGTGSQFADWLIKRSYEGAKEKGKALIFDSEYRDDKISAAAAKADEITWAHIWAAAKAQIKATTDLKVGSEEYFQAAAKLFNEAIEKTQVYDSVLTKSENMRSKSTFTQMTTAFMAEPTTSLNMIWQAANEVKGKNYKNAGKLAGSVLSSIIFNAILKSLVTAARDDDEDESYAEKYLQEVIANFTGDVGIWNMIPVVKDVASIFEGYTVDRTDVSLIEDLYRGFQTFNSDKKSGWEKTKALIGPLAAFFGLPVKNVIRDGEAAWNVITMFLEGRILGSGTGVKYAMLNGLTNNNSGNGQYYEILYDAQREGNEVKYQEVYDLLISKGVDEKDIKTGIRKYYRESKAVKRELESYEEKIVRLTYYDKLEEEKRDEVISKIRTYLVEKAVNNDTGEELSSSTKKAINAEEKGVSAATYFLASAGFEDADGSGGISNKEKIAAINKMDISHAEKVVLISLYTSRGKSK